MSREALIAGAAACAMILQTRGLTTHASAAKALVANGLAVNITLAQSAIDKAMAAVYLPVRDRMEQATALPHAETEPVLLAALATLRATGPETEDVVSALTEIGQIIGLNAQRYLV